MFIPLPHWQVYAPNNGNLSLKELYWLPFTSHAELNIKIDLSQLG
jgi:hypothetical protein